MTFSRLVAFYIETPPDGGAVGSPLLQSAYNCLGESEDLFPIFAEIKREATRRNVDARLLNFDSEEFAAEVASPSDPGRLFWNTNNSSSILRGIDVGAGILMRGHALFGCPPAINAIVENKFLTTSLARNLGLLTPSEILVRADGTRSYNAALERASSFFVKPNWFGGKVMIDKKSHQAEFQRALFLALERAAESGSDFLVQQFLPGEEWRVLRVGGLEGRSIGVFKVVNDGGPFLSREDRADDRYSFQMLTATEGGSLYAEACELADSLADLLECNELCTLDLRIDGERLYFLEINTMPAWQFAPFDQLLAPKYGSAATGWLDILEASLVRQRTAPMRTTPQRH